METDNKSPLAGQNAISPDSYDSRTIVFLLASLLTCIILFVLTGAASTIISLATLITFFIISRLDPFRTYFLIQEARNQVISEPRVYTQTDMQRLDSGQSVIRDWTLASGSYQQQSQDAYNVSEMQLIFSSSVSRPMGAFFSKPKCLLWTISGYGNDFSIQEGLVSETGKCYWVERHDFDVRGKILKLVHGHWDYVRNEFVGEFVDSDRTMGSYPTLLQQIAK